MVDDRKGAVVHRATEADADTIGGMLDAFNREYDEPSPGPVWIAERVRGLMAAGDMVVLLIGDGPEGVAVLRFRPSMWSEAVEAYLAELYVVPERRGQGLGRALLEEVIVVAREVGADRIELNTSEDDVAARGLYERFGFTDREGRPDGPIMYYYEREL
jgi:ribosomal protein S18 acetylase RimI-like enzyme